MIRELKKTRNVAGRITSQHHSPAIPMDATLTEHLQSAISARGGDSHTLISGAGHDAMVIAQMAPTSLLFVRCLNGISHHPDEYVSPEDIVVALEVMVGAVLSLTASLDAH